MVGFRFSLRWVFAAVAFIAVVTAALTDGSPRWAALIALTSVFALLASLLGVIYRREELRSFWVGFALFGWTFLLLSLETAGLNEAAPTNEFMKELYPFFRRTLPVNPATPNPGWVHETAMENGRTVAVIVSAYDFHRLGRSICTIASAFVGGMLGRWFFATRNKNLQPAKSSDM